jgi:hypothetical protein
MELVYGLSDGSPTPFPRVAVAAEATQGRRRVDRWQARETVQIGKIGDSRCTSCGSHLTGSASLREADSQLLGPARYILTAQ